MFFVNLIIFKFLGYFFSNLIVNLDFSPTGPIITLVLIFVICDFKHLRNISIRHFSSYPPSVTKRSYIGFQLVFLLENLLSRIW